MPRLDRYLVAQYLTLFGFFALVLVMVYWVNRAVGLFDRLIGDGQSARVFLEFSLLTLPNVIRLVLPVAAFAAAVHVTNRLTQDGELVVMRATGFSALRLARPALVFGGLVAGMMLMLTHWAVPASRAILAERSAEIEANVTSRLLSDGRFIHPAEGVTFFIGEIAPTGELRDVFLSDDRAEGRSVAYAARRALIVRGDEGPKLIMIDGTAQEWNSGTGRLAVTDFADVTYDLGDLLKNAGRTRLTLEELPTPVLLAPPPAVLERAGATLAEARTEAHLRFAQPFLAPAAALIGFAALLLGSFSRFGLWRQIGVAIVLLILVQMANNAALAAAARDAGAWPLAYLAPVLGLSLGAGLLWRAERPRRVAAAPPAGAAP